MEIRKKGNKFSFGIGVFLFLAFGFTILLSGFEIKAVLGFLVGVYNILQNGFFKDTSNWKLKPTIILIISILILIGSYSFFSLKKSNNIDFQKHSLIEKMVQDAKYLPIDIGNGDSIIGLTVVNKHTLEYRYKLNTNILDIDSSSLADFNTETRTILSNQIDTKKNEVKTEWKKNKIIFSHVYLDEESNLITIIKINPEEY